MYARVAAGLDRIDDAGVRLCAQTLPPFPWYMGGQLFCNLFVGADRHRRLGRELRPPAVPRRLPLQAGRQLRASRSPRPSTCWPRTPTTSTSSTPPVSTARASRSATARSTGRCSPSSSTSTRRAPASSPRSGRATSTTARGSGSPSSGWSSGSDDGQRLARPTALWAIPVSDARRGGPPRARRGARRHPRLAPGVPVPARPPGR